MSFGILNVLMLFGLAAIVIPPLIHLLNRRRYNVVDWGAMQFLLISDAKRRRLLIEEILLMALRMLLIAVMVLGLADVYGVSPLFSSLGMRPGRDVVLVFGGSAGMGVTGAHAKAKEWALQFLDDLEPGDNVMVLQAKQQAVPVLATPTGDLDLVRKAIEELPPPGGGCDWPRAVQEAQRLLARSERPVRTIILLGDGQRYGWADDDSRSYWEAIAEQGAPDADVKPGVWVLNFDRERSADAGSWSLAPLRTRRVTAYVKQDMDFRTDLLLHGQSRYQPPEWVRLEVDGDADGRRNLRFPSKSDFTKQKQPAGQAGRPDTLAVPLPPFKVQFKSPGSHLVSVIAKPKGKPEVRQDYAVEVLALPVLIVDGDAGPGVEKRRSDFLRLALDPRKDATKEPPTAVLAEVVPYDKFDVKTLNPPPGKRQPKKDPRVLVLANVPRLTEEQRRGVAQFLEAGGGVLITLGDHVEANREHYNTDLYRDGAGWLPARLERVVKAGALRAAGPQTASFNHPALELFRKESFGGLNDASFPRWWQVTPADGKTRGVAVARLTGKDPLLVETTYKAGRVILCTVPLMNSRDNKDVSWDTNLTRLPVFAPLAHELVAYLAGNLSTAEKSGVQITYNLQPGQPLVFELDGGEAEDRITLEVPGGKPEPVVFEGARRPGVHPARIHRPAADEPSAASPEKGTGPLEERSSPLFRAARSRIEFEGTYHTGVYTLRVPRKEDWLPAATANFFDGVLSATRKVYYTVEPEGAGEYDLTPASAEDRAAVARAVPMTYATDGTTLLATLTEQADTQELWVWLMAAVLFLICCEVWLTRRIVRSR